MDEPAYVSARAAAKALKEATDSFAQAARSLRDASAGMKHAVQVFGVRPVRNLVSEEALIRVKEDRKGEAEAEFSELLSAAESGVQSLREEREALAAERLRRSGAVAEDVRSAVAADEADHAAKMRRAEARAEAARSEAAEADARREAAQDGITAATAAIREAERGAGSRQRQALRGLRRVRAQADASEAAVRALRRELRGLRSRTEAERRAAREPRGGGSGDASSSSSAAASAGGGDAPRTPEDEAADLDTAIAQMRARVTLLRAASERSPERAKGASVRSQWAGTLEAARERREVAEAELPELRKRSATAGQQLATLIENVLPSDDQSDRAAGRIMRKLLQHGAKEPWGSLRPAVSAACGSDAVADSALAELVRMGVVRRLTDDRVELALPVGLTGSAS